MVRGNALIGDVIAADVTNSYIRSESRLVTAVGLDNIVLIETVDAVMAVARDRAQDISLIVDKLQNGRARRTPGPSPGLSPLGQL